MLRELDSIDGLDWIRVLYVFPMYLTEELIETLAGAKRIIPYLDMPLQHINDRLLRRMNPDIVVHGARVAAVVNEEILFSPRVATTL